MPLAVFVAACWLSTAPLSRLQTPANDPPLFIRHAQFKAYVRSPETVGARKKASELLASSSETLLPRTWRQL